MKKIFVMIFVSLVTLGAFASERVPADVQELWERGGRLYSAGDYNGAVAAYDSIVNAGWESAPLYYNLGCAHFKAGKGGKAILNYYRAQRLAPSDDDVAYNLAYAQSFVKDKIEAVPEFAVSRWMGNIKHLMGVDGWAVVSLVMLGIVLIAGGFYLLAQRRKIRKAGFVVGVVAALMFIFSLGFGGSAKSALVSDSEAVVLSTAAVVKASPERTGKDLFILHEGTKVEVLDAFGEWSEIRIADGNEGWIRTTSIEII
ncbi:MAG: competence protein [Tidjanibacter sp.]|nr:competence protein [Tidjanibacter sp.]